MAMKRVASITLAVGLTLAWAAPSLADDHADCAAIATRQTGYNPAAPPPPAQANMQVAGSGARARGAAAGAIIGGASGGDAGKGAAAGAVAGGVTQRSRNRRSARAQNDAVASQQAAYSQALSACMASRGH
jgi:hypothetical protein